MLLFSANDFQNPANNYTVELVPCWPQVGGWDGCASCLLLHNPKTLRAAIEQEGKWQIWTCNFMCCLHTSGIELLLSLEEIFWLDAPINP